jgi:hypothetical protein
VSGINIRILGRRKLMAMTLKEGPVSPDLEGADSVSPDPSRGDSALPDPEDTDSVSGGSVGPTGARTVSNHYRCKSANLGSNF